MTGMVGKWWTVDDFSPIRARSGRRGALLHWGEQGGGQNRRLDV